MNKNRASRQSRQVWDHTPLATRCCVTRDEDMRSTGMRVLLEDHNIHVLRIWWGSTVVVKWIHVIHTSRRRHATHLTLPALRLSSRKTFNSSRAPLGKFSLDSNRHHRCCKAVVTTSMIKIHVCSKWHCVSPLTCAPASRTVMRSETIFKISLNMRKSAMNCLILSSNLLNSLSLEGSGSDNILWSSIIISSTLWDTFARLRYQKLLAPND